MSETPPRAKPGIPLEIFDIASNIYANSLARLSTDQVNDTAWMNRIQALAIAHAYELHHAITNTEPPAIPAVTDTPWLSQSGHLLNCTMGNWTGGPTTYSYLWNINGAPPPPDIAALNSPTFALTTDNVGKSATCTVTAANFLGTTTAPPSNSVTIQAFVNP